MNLDLNYSKILAIKKGMNKSMLLEDTLEEKRSAISGNMLNGDGLANLDYITEDGH